MNVGLNVPLSIISIAQLCGLQLDNGVEAQFYLLFLGFVVIFLFPYASLCQFPNLYQNIARKILTALARRPNRTATVLSIT